MGEYRPNVEVRNQESIENQEQSSSIPVRSSDNKKTVANGVTRFFIQSHPGRLDNTTFQANFQ